MIKKTSAFAILIFLIPALGQSQSTLPVDHFTGLRLDSPLQTSFATGKAIRLSGTLTDTSLSEIQFHFTPTDGDDPIRFFFDVIDGHFDGHLLFDHQQAGEYELNLYVYNKEDESWPWLDYFSPVQILQGQGEIYLPIDFFSGIILDAPLTTEHPIERLLVLEGKVANHIHDFEFLLKHQDYSRYLQASMENGRFRLPLRFHAYELGNIQVTAYAELVDGEHIPLGEFLFTAVDSPAPELQVGVLALSLLPDESVIVPLLNRGEQDLELSPPLIEGPYEVIAFPKTIEAAARAGLEIVYRGNGDQSGVLTIVSNDPLQPEVKVALSGLRPAEPGVDLAHFRSGSDGMISIPWDFSTGHFVAALYSGQIAQVDTGVVYNFSLGGRVPAAKPIAENGVMNRRDEVEMLLRRREREQADRIRTQGWRAAKLVQAAYRVGDKRSFFFGAWDNVEEQTISATAVAVSNRAVAFVQDDLRADTDNLSNDEFQQVIDVFSDDFELITDVFGAPSDVDGDGKVLFLFTHLVDDVGVGGFYNSSSVLPVENGGNGNHADMMFISPSLGVAYCRSLLIHELQHLINYNQHVIVRSGQSEESWLNEGLSHLSEDLVENGHQNGGNQDNIRDFLSQPGTVGLMGANFNGAKRGAAYLFVRSLADRLGQDVIQRLVQTGLADRDNIETASGEKFEDLLAVWAAQIYASGNGLVDHPRLNYAFNLLHTSAGRGFPLPTTLQFSPESGFVSGTLRARGVNFVEVRGEGITTVEIETEATSQVGAIVLPLSGDFIPAITIPKNYFKGVLFDEPLAAMTTGTSLNISGTLTDFSRFFGTSLSEIQFHFTPTDGDDPIRFFFDVIDGHFDGHLLFDHQQAGEYELNLYVYNKEDESWPWLDYFSPVQILQGQGEILVPATYFQGLTLDATLSNQFTTGTSLNISGTLTDISVTDISFYFIPTDGGDPIDFIFDVIDGRFDGHLLFDHQQTGEYELILYVYNKEDESWSGLGYFSPVLIIDGRVQTVVDSDLASTPEHFVLHPNFPNPFNASTMIRYELPSMVSSASTPVQLTIYNLLGHTIRTLIDQQQEPGYHSILWDGRNSRGLSVASGVYFYRISVGEHIRSRRMLLLR